VYYGNDLQFYSVVISSKILTIVKDSLPVPFISSKPVNQEAFLDAGARAALGWKNTLQVLLGNQASEYLAVNPSVT